MEDAIGAVGVNKEKKFVKIGINTDAQNWYVEDTKKYEWDGPKNPLDSDQLMDFYDKVVADHPLVEYLEDCYAISDLKGFKKYLARCQGDKKLKLGVNQLFRSDLDLIK